MIEPSAGLLVGGKYLLRTMLGSGGMGSVWEAEHSALGSTVAVKFMSPALVDRPDARARFEREARSAAQITSPHVVNVYDHGVEQGLPYIVMEKLEGEDLGTRIRAHGALPLDEVRRMVREVARGLDRAHEQGIVHRDLKPANVFLCTRDGDLVKLLDFGVARPVELTPDDVTSPGLVLGSPQYMSPEQASGRVVDSRSDVWSLAVVAYRMLTGERPFLGRQVGDLIVQICTKPHTPATQNMPTLPASVNTFFDKALAKDKGARFQTAHELSDALDIALATPEQAERAARREHHKALKTTVRTQSPVASSRSLGSLTGAVTTTSTELDTTTVMAAEEAVSEQTSGVGRVALVALALAAGGLVAVGWMYQAPPEPAVGTTRVSAPPSSAGEEAPPTVGAPEAVTSEQAASEQGASESAETPEAVTASPAPPGQTPVTSSDASPAGPSAQGPSPPPSGAAPRLPTPWPKTAPPSASASTSPNRSIFRQRK